MGVSPRQSGPLQNLQRAMLLILLCNGEHEELPTARPQQEEMAPIGSWGWEELQRWPPTNHSPTVSTRASERIPTFCSHSNMGVWMSTTISEVRVKLRGVATFWCVNRWTRSWMYHQGSYKNSSMVTKTSADRFSTVQNGRCLTKHTPKLPWKHMNGDQQKQKRALLYSSTHRPLDS